jgi:hypothetical protein
MAENEPRGSGVDVLVMGIERKSLVARQVDATLEPCQMWPVLVKNNLDFLQQHVRMRGDMIVCLHRDGDSYQYQ